MHNQATQAIFDYWHDLKGDLAAPLRAEIDPAALRRLLPNLFLIAENDEAALAFRLAGTRLCELRDRELREAPFSDLWRKSDREIAVAVAENAIRFESPALLHVSLASMRKEYCHEMLLLPLRLEEDRGSDRLLGALFPRFAAVPAFDLPVETFSLMDWRFISGIQSRCEFTSTSRRETVYASIDARA